MLHLQGTLQSKATYQRLHCLDVESRRGSRGLQGIHGCGSPLAMCISNIPYGQLSTKLHVIMSSYHHVIVSSCLCVIIDHVPSSLFLTLSLTDTQTTLGLQVFFADNKFCEAQARVRQGSARDGPQGDRPQSLNPCLELTLKLVATHHPPPPEV